MTEVSESQYEYWKGHSWQRQRFREFSLLHIEKNCEENYAENLQRLGKLASEVIDINKRILEFPSPHIEIAVFPDVSFREDIQLSNLLPEWVKVCVREQRVCYSHILLSNQGNHLRDMQPEQRREIVHEIFHPYLDHVLPNGLKLPLSINEGLAEAIPRFILGYQKELPESTYYLTHELISELVPPWKIDRDGMFMFSQEPLSRNKGYMSSLVYVLGIAASLDASLLNGIRKIVWLATQSFSHDSFVENLSQAIEIDESVLCEGKLLQERGISFISASQPELYRAASDLPRKC